MVSETVRPSNAYKPRIVLSVNIAWSSGNRIPYESSNTLDSMLTKTLELLGTGCIEPFMFDFVPFVLINSFSIKIYLS